MPKRGGFREFVARIEGKEIIPFDQYRFVECNEGHFPGIVVRSLEHLSRVFEQLLTEDRVVREDLNRALSWSSVGHDFHYLMNTTENRGSVTEAREILNILYSLLEDLRRGVVYDNLSLDSVQEYTRCDLSRDPTISESAWVDLEEDEFESVS